MYKIYIPVSKGKKKTRARGLWLDDDKLYYDYVKIVKSRIISERNCRTLCEHYNQLALFYTKDKIGYLYTAKTNNVNILTKRLVYKHKGYRGLKDRLKELLKVYEGLTVYIRGNNYIIEVYYN